MSIRIGNRCGIEDGQNPEATIVYIVDDSVKLCRRILGQWRK